MVDAAWRRLMATASGRYGVVTLENARDAGVDPQRLTRAAVRGEVERMAPGVYRFPTVPPSERQAARIATATTGGVLSGETALALWGCDGCRFTPITVMVEHGRSARAPGVTTVRRRGLSPLDVVERHRLPVLRPIPALIDAAGVLAPETLEVALVSLHKLRVATLEEVGRAVAALDGRGRVGVGVLRRLVEQATSTGLRESPLEILLDDLVHRHGLPAPARQVPIEVGGRVYRPDFVWLPQRVIVECDGVAGHAGARELRADLQRQNHLVAAGFVVLRFTWWDVRDQPDQVVRHVLDALRRAA